MEGTLPPDLSYETDHFTSFYTTTLPVVVITSSSHHRQETSGPDSYRLREYLERKGYRCPTTPKFNCLRSFAHRSLWSTYINDIIPCSPPSVSSDRVCLILLTIILYRETSSSIYTPVGGSQSELDVLVPPTPSVRVFFSVRQQIKDLDPVKSLDLEPSTFFSTRESSLNVAVSLHIPY